MQRLWISAALVAASACFATAYGQDCNCQQGSGGDGGYCDPCCDPYGHCKLFGGHHKGARYEGLDPGFNCGCNGSYKFPVPPLYTYHWPGMWSAQLMTDYHSPWRFPPLKPYVDEVPAPTMGAVEGSLRRVRPASAEASSSRSAEPVSFSSRLREMTR